MRASARLFSLVTGLFSAGIAWPALPQGNPQPPPADISNVTQSLSGTLFFTREQRQRMDNARSRGEHLEVEGVVFAPEQPSVINGFVKRSDQKATVWVDGRPRADLASGQVRKVTPTDVGGESGPKILSEDISNRPPTKRTKTRSKQAKAIQSPALK